MSDDLQTDSNADFVKRTSITVGELRQKYGAGFAQGYGDQDKIGEVLGRAGGEHARAVPRPARSWQIVVSPSAEDRARRIKVIVFDVDGVLTDGQIIIVPDPRTRSSGDPVGTGVEVKGFAAHDGLGISLARLGGLRIGIITKRVSQTVAIRARDLNVEWLYQGQAHKLHAAQEIASKAGVALDEIAYVGDDIVDLPVMRVCGLAIATANARPQCKAEAHYVTTNSGGHGAGRDAIDFILSAQGSLERCIEQYLDAENPAAANADVGSGNM